MTRIAIDQLAGEIVISINIRNMLFLFSSMGKMLHLTKNLSFPVCPWELFLCNTRETLVIGKTSFTICRSEICSKVSISSEEAKELSEELEKLLLDSPLIQQDFTVRVGNIKFPLVEPQTVYAGDRKFFSLKTISVPES